MRSGKICFSSTIWFQPPVSRSIRKEVMNESGRAYMIFKNVALLKLLQLDGVLLLLVFHRLFDSILAHSWVSPCRVDLGGFQSWRRHFRLFFLLWNSETGWRGFGFGSLDWSSGVVVMMILSLSFSIWALIWHWLGQWPDGFGSRLSIVIAEFK